MKVFAFAMLASVGAATVASADTSYIALQHELSSRSLVSLDLVRCCPARHRGDR